MNTSDLPAADSALPKHRLVIVLAIVVVTAAVGAALWKWRRQAEKTNREDDPRLTYSTPYRNVHPDVKYVGDQVCADCHPTQAETYRRHPMGRSLLPVSAVSSEERYGPETHNPFEKFDFFFQVIPRDGKVYHRQVRKNAKEHVITEHEDEIQFVLGSGSQGRSYLINREGYLFQSPVSWFSQEQTWDLSPGFSESILAGRPVRSYCLVCHCNRVHPVAGTENRYQLPVFEGYAIGCERCHGPGELHIQPGAGDDTIVNPARLEPALREAVCQQCHLLGKVRIQRRNRQVFDYRPGLPLYLFRSVFVSAAEMNDSHQAVGHVDQMYSSRCFQASKGKFGCISCHDPHRVPSPAEKVKFYRDRCVRCHTVTAANCSMPRARRMELSKDDSCIQCHMSRYPNQMIGHTANTDHRVLRRPAAVESHAPGPNDSTNSPLANFYQALLGTTDQEEDRDLGLALIQYARTNPDPGGRASQRALPLLEKAMLAHSDDVPAWEAKAQALWQLGRGLEAEAMIEKALERSPNLESALGNAGLFAEDLGHDAAAIDYWRRVILVNPWRTFYRIHLAGLLAKHEEWTEAAKECRAILELEPANSDIRLLLVRCLLQMGMREPAGKEFEILAHLNPKNEANLRRWFNEQLSLMPTK